MAIETPLYSHLPSGRVVLYVDPRKGTHGLRARQLRRPHTDDMVQMLEDLGIEPVVTFEAWHASFLRRMGLALALPYDDFIRECIVDEYS